MMVIIVWKSEFVLGVRGACAEDSKHKRGFPNYDNHHFRYVQRLCPDISTRNSRNRKIETFSLEVFLFWAHFGTSSAVYIELRQRGTDVIDQTKMRIEMFGKWRQRSPLSMDTAREVSIGFLFSFWAQFFPSQINVLKITISGHSLLSQGYVQGLSPAMSYCLPVQS